ncbi:MAG TPA: chaplin family protein, partial [Streptosporangiaceae bacterium]|nr:chaplin family protein [Streptosporangiaceae bacterium]
VGVPVSVPVNVCGNAVALLGIADAGCRGGAKVSGGNEGSGPQTSGKGSVLGGNQVGVPVSVPVNVCGNSAAVLGKATATCRGGSSVGKPTSPPTTTAPTPPSAKHHHHGSNPPSSGSNPPSSGSHSNGGTPPSGTGSHHPDASLTSSDNGLLPTTGADLAGLLAIALGAIAAGAASLFTVRRRRLAGRA